MSFVYEFVFIVFIIWGLLKVFISILLVGSKGKLYLKLSVGFKINLWK